MTTAITESQAIVVPITKLSKDAIAAMRAGEEARASGEDILAGRVGASNNTTARILVDMYYSMQDARKAMASKSRAITDGSDPSGGNDVFNFMLRQSEAMEDNAKGFIADFITHHVMWPWFKQVPGIGVVLSAGIASHLGVRDLPPTVGHWWRYAGLDPSQQWLSKDKLSELWKEQEGDIDQRTRTLSVIVGRDPMTVIRDAVTNHKTGEVTELTKAKAIKSLARIPFNRPLKTLMWKVGDSFVKLGSKEDSFYSTFYRNRKAEEIFRNERGDRAELARKTLMKMPNHAQKAVYAEGKLPDGRVDLMARRATEKLFLSHLHELWWKVTHGWEEPPKPFSISVLGHAHYIRPPYQDVLKDSMKRQEP